jgi:hypothetical protein
MPFDGADFSTPAPEHLTWRAVYRMIVPKLRRVGVPAPVPQVEPDTSSAVQLLRAARALIADEGSWTKGCYRSFTGRYCAVGALRAVAAFPGGRDAYREAHSILCNVAAWRGFPSVEKMNDASSHRQVLASFDEAIAIAGEEASRRMVA